MMYVLTSSLLIPKTTPAIEEVVGYELDDAWNEVAAETGGAPVLHVTLPVQHSAAHRIALAEPAHAGALRIRRLTYIGIPSHCRSLWPLG